VPFLELSLLGLDLHSTTYPGSSLADSVSMRSELLSNQEPVLKLKVRSDDCLVCINDLSVYLFGAVLKWIHVDLTD
jgi:hypothetical protein